MAFSYQNCVLAEVDGTVVGMAHSFPMDADPAAEPQTDPVLRPYAELEDYGSLYLSGIALFTEHRRRGIGTKLMASVDDRARALGRPRVSLICFERNEGAMRLYRRLNFEELARRAVVPHPLLHYSDGDAVLLARVGPSDRLRDRVTAFTAAIDALFADPNLATDAVYRAGGADPGVPVRAIIRRPDRIGDFGETRIVTETTTFDIRVSEIAAPAEGDTIEVDSVTYVIQGEPPATSGARRPVWSGSTRKARSSARKQGLFLAIPTPAAGRFGDARQKITPGAWERIHGLRLRFVYRRGSPSLLVADNARLTKRGRAAANIGRRQGAAFTRLSGRTTVPLFILVPQVTVRKRLDVDGAAQKWIAALPQLVVRHWFGSA